MAFLFMLVNYADKAVVGLSSAAIMRDLGLSHTQFGELGSAFFLLFSLSGVAVGFLANHLRTKTLMLAMALLWSCPSHFTRYISGLPTRNAPCRPVSSRAVRPSAPGSSRR
jgi:MFS family permease